MRLAPSSRSGAPCLQEVGDLAHASAHRGRPLEIDEDQPIPSRSSTLDVSYLVYAALSPFAAVALVWVLRRATRGTVPGATSLVALAVGGLWWLACDLLAMTAGGRMSVIAHHAMFIGIPWVALAWLDFAITFTGQTRLRRVWPVKVAIAVAVLTNVVVLTSGVHDLFWTSIEQGDRGPFTAILPTYGPWFWVHAAVSWSASVIGSFIVVREYAGGLRTFQRLSVWLAIASLTPIVVDLVVVFGILPVEKGFSTIAFSFGAVVFAASTLRYRFLDLQPTARSVLMESLSEGVVAIDLEGRVTDFNGAFASMAIGLEVGGDVLEVVPDLEAALTGSTGEIVVEAGPEPRSFEWRAADLETDGRPRGRLIVLRDVTDRIVTEMALRQALLDVEARNADLDAFAHTVAHDLKNPINAIRGYAELLLDEGDDLGAEIQTQSMKTIYSVAGKMNDIVAELLLLAGVRNQTVTPVPIDMLGVVEGALDRLEPFLREHDAVLEVEESWPTAVGYGPW
ncbi:histidine kinase N-terminal 7TM domain-containing protein, partial [Rubrivirga sp.]|uniref:histidine kinase N-terminal 7TM domain-containing protein n=1 Tax=Rubrivirga sp. TaxID=1885344 RepID=UPI003C74FD5A